MLLYRLATSLLCLSMLRGDSCQCIISSSSRHAVSRRKLFSSAWGSAAFAIASTAILPPAVYAEDALFRKNPLTNKFLEKIRIINQEAADNISYDGELAPASPRTTYASLLVPILSIQEELTLLYEMINRPNGAGLSQAQDILSQPRYQVKELKQTFNAFADNIYYTDPDRANVYLAGGATPKNSQSLAYLLRNELLTNLEELRTEIAYLLKVQKKNEVIDASDVIEYGTKCSDAMSEYLALVPPEELKMAKEIFVEKYSKVKKL